jgi:hypothetical protein
MMKIQTMSELAAEMQAVAGGDLPAPANTVEPSMDPAEALRREREAALDALAREARELKLGYDE